LLSALACFGADLEVSENDDEIRITGSAIEAAVRKKGYVSGVAAGSFLDHKTGFRDPGFGLDIADFLLEPGSDEAYRSSLDPQLAYEFDNLFHGRFPNACWKGRRSAPEPKPCLRRSFAVPASSPSTAGFSTTAAP
jgi:hypothetical protein